jgi:hypothetical protein
MRVSLVTALFLFAVAPLSAQRVTLGIDAALADYREQGPALRFTGGGLAGRAAVEMWRIRVHARATRVHVTGASESAEVTDAFDIAQNDVAVRMRLTPRVSIEAGILSRTMTPEHAAQSMQAWRAGGVFLQPLAPGADLAVRAAYLGATKFGGGGTAAFGLDVGLAVSYGPGSGRVRLTAEYDFQRIDRKTRLGDLRVDVPIQSAIARIGVAAAFGR